MQLYGPIFVLGVALRKKCALQDIQYHDIIFFFPMLLDNGPPHSPILLIAPLHMHAPSPNVTHRSGGNDGGGGSRGVGNTTVNHQRRSAVAVVAATTMAAAVTEARAIAAAEAMMTSNNNKNDNNNVMMEQCQQKL